MFTKNTPILAIELPNLLICITDPAFQKSLINSINGAIFAYFTLYTDAYPSTNRFNADAMPYTTSKTPPMHYTTHPDALMHYLLTYSDSFAIMH